MRSRTSALRLVCQLPSRRLALPLTSRSRKLLKLLVFLARPSTTSLAMSLLTSSTQLLFRLTLWVVLLRLKLLATSYDGASQGKKPGNKSQQRAAMRQHVATTYRNTAASRNRALKQHTYLIQKRDRICGPFFCCSFDVITRSTVLQQHL